MTKRREFLKYAGVSSLALAASGLSSLAWADSKTRTRSTTGDATVPTNTGIGGNVVVIGGGMAGATVAKYLRLWGGTGVKVTLVERDPFYTSSIMSNLVLSGQRNVSSLQFSYGFLASRYGVTVKQDEVVAIDPVGRKITLASGSRLSYDRLIVAPGIDFDVVPGLETADAQKRVPHAWKAGSQTTDLRNMITAMPNGGVFAMTIPAAPYRCPPGPYERACVVADWLKKNRPGSKVLVLDANPGITAEVNTFTTAFTSTHKGIIEYHPNVDVNSVNANSLTISTSAGNTGVNVLNVIPPHRAGKVLTNNGLADLSGKWTSVDVHSYEAIHAPGVHVIGDAAATGQPKAGHVANQEAKVCADAVIRLLSGRSVDPAPITNSACYSPITADTASWLTAVYSFNPTTGLMGIVPGASGEGHATQENFQDMSKWFSTLMSDSFA
jgi:NADPH-dependent 2,4-dienoyl-CoA reductase/sulfur reductase-like enzyme